MSALCPPDAAGHYHFAILHAIRLYVVRQRCLKTGEKSIWWHNHAILRAGLILPVEITVMRIISLLLVFALGLAMGSVVSRAEMTGNVCVESGDTIALNAKRSSTECIGGIPVRLHGIDAPEIKQQCREPSGHMVQCGRYAAAYLLDLVKHKEVVCKGNSQDRYGQWLLICFLDGMDLNGEMVRSGWAVAYEYLTARYMETEKGAQEAGIGLWGMEFVRPDKWRDGIRLADADGKDACMIKGNIGLTGEKTYYLPGDEWYDETRIDESKDERWFCNEDEAVAAGWHPASE